MNEEKSYRFLDHTADLSVEAWGKSHEELVAHFSKALTEIIVDVNTVVPKQEVKWSIVAEGPESLLVRQLQEILYRFEVEEMVFSEFKISHQGLNAIQCVALGEFLDLKRHRFKTEIKAVTYHQLKLEEVNGVWRAKVIFDI